MADARFHVLFADPESGEELGLLLTEAPALGFSRRLINPYAAKASHGAMQDQDLTEWSLLSQRDWRAGRGQERLEDATAYFDSHNLESRIEGQLTLGPLPQDPAGTYPRYEPGSAKEYGLGYMGSLLQSPGATVFDSTISSAVGSYTFYAYVAFPGMTNRITAVKMRVKKTGSPNAAVRLGIHANVNGTVGAELAGVDVAAASVSTSYGWITFTLATTLAVAANTIYWVRVSSSCTVGSYEVQFGMAGGRPRDVYEVVFSKVGYAMSFQAPVAGMTCTLVQLYLKKAGHPGTYTVSLCDDSGGGLPAGVLKTKTVDMNASLAEDFRWIEVVWSSGQALTGSATYHVTVEGPATADAKGCYVVWGGTLTGYATGNASRKIGSEAWSARADDLFFRVNREVLENTVVGFARFSGKWYCAAGDTVYVWDGGAKTWTVSEAVTDAEVTSMEVWGGYLWVARGTEDDVRIYNGGWNDATGPIKANLLKAGGGYLHRTNPTAGSRHELYYTADGTDWEGPIDVGSGDYEITAMEWYRDMIICATAVRLWGMTADMAYPLVSWQTQEDANNGKGMLNWSKTGCMYIPLLFGLYRWNGDSMAAVGPEQGTGLPATRAGKIKALVGTCNWLFAAVDAGASGYSSILAYGGQGGWHEMQRCEQVGQVIQALGFETLDSPSRLYFGMGSETRYLLLPDYSDNPYQYTGYEFNASGELETSWIGSELLEVVKDVHELVIRGEGLTSSQVVDVFYEVDRSGQWTFLGRVTDGPRQGLVFPSSTFVAKVTTTGCTTTTIELAAGSVTTDMAAGDWVRINGEVRQVASITDSDTFVLETALSTEPEGGVTVYASRAAGREFRIKLVLSTDDKTLTPKVQAMFVRYQNNVLDRFIYALQVRVADGMVDLAGNPYPYSAAEVRGLLDGWVKRACQFTLYDPDGTAQTVKVVSVGEGGYQREQGAGALRYGSVYSINLVEVG